ncbi:MAG TPA: protein kinase, partial [Candidatus Limnocylindrales bacterium]|nr:protein kinase [Candidatus Limnocylindrales bacterium]
MMASETLLGGRYELHERIGAGGMATVWRGRDTRLGRPVAVKLLRPQFAEDPEFTRRFEVEARNAASLAHPNVATVFDTGADGGLRYIVMELVNGPSVAEILKAQGTLPPLQAADVAAAAARALAAAHRRGLIHRDVKPANILVGRDGRVRLADFGIARALTTSRVTVPGTILGSIPYLSPEQARGEEATAAGDVFSLGVVLYEMLTGRLPWVADGPAALATVRTTEAPVPLAVAREDLPPSLGAIVERALRIDPATRYPSARAFAETLETWARRTASSLPPEPDLADTAVLVAERARPYDGAGGADDPLVADLASPLALAGAAIARPNPTLGDDDQWPDSDRVHHPDAPNRSDVPDPSIAEPASVAAAAPDAHDPSDAPLPPTPTTAMRAPAGRVIRRPTAMRRPAPRPAPRGNRRARLVALAALVPILLLGLLAATQLGGIGDATDAPSASGDLIAVLDSTPTIEASAAPSASAVPPPSPSTASSSPASATPTAATPTMPPGPRLGVPPIPGPTATPRPTATARPDAPVTTATTSSPAAAVSRFYAAVEAHDWDTAIALWSPSMRERYPPQEWLIDR